MGASHTPHNIDWRLSVTAFVLYGALFIATVVGLIRLIITSRRRYWKLEQSNKNDSNNSNSEHQSLIGSNEKRTLLAAKRASRDSNAFGTQKAFHYVLMLFVLFRLAWFTAGLIDSNLDDSNPDLLEFALNRGALCTFFTAFTIVFFYWVHSFHSLYFDTGEKNPAPALTWFFGLTNVAIYIFQISVVGLYLYRHTSWRLQPLERDDLYTASIMVAGASDLLASLGFLVYGVRLFTIGKEHSDELSPESRRQRLTTLLATLVFCSCFTLRFAMFLWVPIDDDDVSADLFMVFAYVLPEVIPSLLQLYIVQKRRSKTERDAQFISDLYAEHDEVRRFEATIDETPSSAASSYRDYNSGSVIYSHNR